MADKKCHLSHFKTGGNAYIRNAPFEEMTAVIDVTRRLGCEVTRTTGGILVKREGRLMPVPYIETMVHPGFPTDLQSVLIVALAVAEGESIVEESIFSDRFKIVGELNRMGANITVNGNTITVNDLGDYQMLYSSDTATTLSTTSKS